MTYCGNCGNEIDPDQVFCGSCGQRLTPTQPGQDGSPYAPGQGMAPEVPQSAPQQTAPMTAGWASAPPGQTTQTGQPGRAGQQGHEFGAPMLPTIDWRKIVVGNWVGAGVTALAMLLTAGLFSLALGALAKPDNFGLDNTLTMIASLLGGTFGADFVISADVRNTELQANVAALPFTVSLLTFGVGIGVFRRVTRGYHDVVAAVGDAARTALLVALPLLLSALLFRSDTKRVGNGWAADLLQLFDARVEFGSSAVGCLFLGFVSVFLVLAASLVVRWDWWPAKVQRIHDWFAAPLVGFATMLATLPLAGLIGLGLLMFGESNTPSEVEGSDDTMAGIAAVVAALANGGMWLISLGTGAAYGAAGSARGGGEHSVESELHHLAYYADDEPGLWAAPLVMLAVLLLSAFMVARSSGEPGRVLGSLLRWLALLFVMVPVALRWTNLHGSFVAEENGERYRGSGYAGADGVQTTFFLFGIAVLCALVIAALTNALDPARIASQVRSIGASLQSNPGAPAAGQPGPQQGGPAGDQYGQYLGGGYSGPYAPAHDDAPAPGQPAGWQPPADQAPTTQQPQGSASVSETTGWPQQGADPAPEPGQEPGQDSGHDSGTGWPHD